MTASLKAPRDLRPRSTIARRPGKLLLGLAVAAVAVLTSGQAVVPPELRNEAAQLLRGLAALRGLPSPGSPPPMVIQNREERRRFVVAELARKYSTARLDAERRALVAWGLVPTDFDLAGFLADLLAEQAAAYYDPRAKRMVLANWLTPELRRDALTHELVHALQDRLVDLDRFLGVPPGRSDAGVARQALVEGEAIALAHDLALHREGGNFAALTDVTNLQRAIRTSVTGPVLARAPDYVRTMLTFPYAEGLGFVHAFRQRRPWSALSALYQDPPRSSTQILHPERYLDRREDPVDVTLPDLTAVLPRGSRVAIEDELGEIGLCEVLRRRPGPSAVADGWRGDRYALWDVPDGPSVLIALVAWDTETLAADFVRRYAEAVGQRRGRSPSPPSDALQTWSGGPTMAATERRQRTVLVLDGVPPAVLDAVRTAVWATPMLY